MHEFIITPVPARRGSGAADHDVSALAKAISKNKSLDARGLMTDETWDALSEFLVRRNIGRGECLIRQGDKSRTLYLLQSGLLRVYRAEGDSRLQLAVLGAGSIVGEGTFFAPIVRNAFVETVEPSVAWELSADTFDELSRLQPRAGMMLCRFLGAVLATRMLSVTGRLSIT